MKAMETLQDLIEEVKVQERRFGGVCVYLLHLLLFNTHQYIDVDESTYPAILLVAGIRILFNEVEFRWKVLNVRSPTCGTLRKKQLSTE
ncbi:hypothetical protein HAX54_019122 [Datura stramonium]|uniref:Uncharacterized protein n=1 Tax=Datura stramonium TaxID=4076 RepID=A0ABS8UP90_DATST|nr:hypothetical protein [Datura stramonium]